MLPSADSFPSLLLGLSPRWSHCSYQAVIQLLPPYLHVITSLLPLCFHLVTTLLASYSGAEMQSVALCALCFWDNDLRPRVEIAAHVVCSFIKPNDPKTLVHKCRTSPASWTQTSNKEHLPGAAFCGRMERRVSPPLTEDVQVSFYWFREAGSAGLYPTQ